VLAAMTLVVLDAGIVNIALPELARALAATPSQAILVVTAYQAGLVMALLPAGALGERFGHRRVFTLGVLVFAIASAGCALSVSLPWLVVARFIQGLGGAAILALGVALLRLTVERERLGAAIGWNALTVALAAAAAPSLGAAILSIAPWPALFAINLPVAIVGLAAARALPASHARGPAPSAVSMLLNAAAFGALIVAGESVISSPVLAVGLLVTGLVAMTRLIRREARTPSPLMPIDLLRSEPFRLSVMASILCFAAQSIGLLALPFLLLHDMHLTPLQAGAHLTVWPLSVAVAAVVAGRLADRISTAWLCAVGGAMLCAGLAGAAVWPLDGASNKLVPFLVLCGVGFGLFQSPNNRNLFLSAPAERSGAAGGMQGTARVTGQTMGSVTVALLFSVSMAGPQIGLALAALLAMLAALVSLFRILCE
jgi:DHA2 family multidrug resistance protein-like MFS transporter